MTATTSRRSLLLGGTGAALGAAAAVVVPTSAEAAETASPWLIHTDCSSGVSPNNRLAVVTVSGVPPYSRSPVCATVPPRDCAMAWKP